MAPAPGDPTLWPPGTPLFLMFFFVVVSFCDNEPEVLWK